MLACRPWLRPAASAKSIGGDFVRERDAIKERATLPRVSSLRYRTACCLLTLGLLGGGCAGSQDREVEAGEDPSDTDSSDPKGKAPVDARSHPAMAMTDEGIFIFGGTSAQGADLTVGAVTDADLAVISDVPEGPFGTDLTNVSAASLGGGEVLVVGTLCDASTGSDLEGSCEPGTLAAARYSIATQSWDEVGLPAGLSDRRGFPSMYGTLESGVLIGFGYLVSERDYWYFDAGSGEFSRVLPEDAGQAIDACLVDGRLARGIYGSGDPSKPSAVSVQITEPLGEGESRVASTVAVGGDYTDITLWCAGSTVLVSESGGLGKLVAIDVASGEISTLETPAEAVGAYLYGAWTGTTYIFLNTLSGQPAVAFDPAEMALRVIPGSDTPLLDFVWTGDDLVGFGSNDGTTVESVSFTVG